MTPNKANTNYQLICGLEIHGELNTASKMFCGCQNNPFHADKPNIHTCPVCLGMPGGIPVPNKKAIESTIKLGLALNCQINLHSKFDRKHYFYPDLAKGYQISQYDLPFCHDGLIETSYGPVRIRRIHLEEDTGKLIHKEVDGKKVTLIDFNRSGVPLIEIVTEPDIRHAAQAKEYGKKLRDLIRFLGIGDCDMEQGGMRLEANISLSEDVNQLPNYKVEVKNINSFRFLEQAIEFEIKRQAEILAAGETPAQETRGFNSGKGVTFSQRTKEEAEDYRYFPDPDIAPIEFTQEQIAAFKKELPLLPAVVAKNWLNEFGIEERFGLTLATSPREVGWFSQLFNLAKAAKLSTNDLAKMIINGKIKVNTSGEPQLALDVFVTNTAKSDISSDEINQAISQVITNNPDEVAKYKAGKSELINFFVGQTMRELKKKVDVALIRDSLVEKLK